MRQERHKPQHLVRVHDRRAEGLQGQAPEADAEEDRVREVVPEGIHDGQEDEGGAGHAGGKDGDEGDEFESGDGRG